MTKRPKSSPRGGSSAPVNALGWRRLPGSARNYRNISDPRYPTGATISDRQMSNISREARFGRKISKETYTKAVKRRELRYADAATELRQTNAKNSRSVREYLPDIAPKDKAVPLKFYRGGFFSLSADEKARFKKMFESYSADDVRQALGSAPKNIGAFRVAA
jgi:hypothetical protein